jgi:mono/diheme cytochrome c family protein
MLAPRHPARIAPIAASATALALLLGGLASLAPPARADGPDQATRDLYKAKCQICHMVDGNSPIKAMNFADGEWHHGEKLADHVKVIQNGVPGKAMRAFKDELTKDQILGLAKYVQTFAQKGAKSAK